MTVTYPPRDFDGGLGAEFDVRVRIHDVARTDSVTHSVSAGSPRRVSLPLRARTDTPFTTIQTVTTPDTKLYGITRAGGVVTVNVRRRDLEPYATP